MAPVGIKVNELPGQINPPFNVTVGVVFTVTLATAAVEDTHPLVLVPLTEYDVVVFGVTVKLPPVIV